MKFIYEDSSSLFEMSNICGRFVVNPGKLPFSFYFSSKQGAKHGIRVKPSFNPNRLILDKTGTLQLSGDWEYIPGEDDKHTSKKDIDDMKKFFRKYLILFILSWDSFLPDSDVAEYFRGNIDFKEMLTYISFYENFSTELDKCGSAADLEKFVRSHLDNLNSLGYPVNLYGN